MGTLTLNLERTRESTSELAKAIDDNTYFRCFYLPHVIIDVFFDYVDTVVNLTAQMRVSAVKKVSRQIKELKKEYEYLKNKYLNYNSRIQALKHMEHFIDVYSEEFENEYRLIVWALSQKRHQLLPEWKTLVASVYLGICVFKALQEYAKEVDAIIETIWKRVTHSIIPDSVFATYNLLQVYLGDCNILEKEDVDSTTSRILALIKSVEFTGEFDKS